MLHVTFFPRVGLFWLLGSMGQFVDWLTVYQEHRPGSLPMVGSEHRIGFSLETGDIVREQVVGFEHGGSWDTSLRIRSDGSSVGVSGNPSAYDRPDNLFGFSSVHTALDCVNREVQGLGLPPLTSERNHEEMRLGVRLRSGLAEDVNGEPLGYRFRVLDQGLGYARGKQIVRDGRARISRVDVTENISTQGAVGFLRHLSMYVHHGKAGDLKPNGRTVTWGEGSRRMYHKYYDKAFDIGLKISDLMRSRNNNKNRDRIEEHIIYLNKLKSWCEENGIVRRETTFKSTELIDRGMVYIESWGIDMGELIRPFQFHKRMDVEEIRFDGVSESLIAKGVPERQARQAGLIHTGWVNGKDARELCGSKTSFYRYRNYLLLIGVDISARCDISRLVLRPVRSEWREVDPPDWYVLPEIRHVA